MLDEEDIVRRTRPPYNRKNIKKKDICLDIIEDEKNNILTVKIVKINLLGYDFPASARIFLEAFNRLDIERIPLGEVGLFSEENIREPLPLPSFKFNNERQRSGIKFRLKIVDIKTGHLLGLVENLKETKYVNSLLSINTDEEINTVYVVCWEDSNNPTLSVNKDFDFEKLKNIKPIIVEAVFKEILTGLLFFECDDLEDELENHKWIQFAQKLVPKADLKDITPDEKRGWINDVIDKFSKKEKIVKKLLKFLEQDL